MARYKDTVYLGYQDEEISDKIKSQLNYTVNKVGGTPDWIEADIKVDCCPICNLKRPLLLQIYAPLESSIFHRTLYVFTCLNSNCSTKPKSWTCIRVQSRDKRDNEVANLTRKSNGHFESCCDGVDDWNESSSNLIKIFPDTSKKQNKEKSNVFNKNMKSGNSNKIAYNERIDDKILSSLTSLSFDENVNCLSDMASFECNESKIFAEIEDEKSELVTVETPVIPKTDLLVLMKQTTDLPTKLKNLTLKSFFINAEEENILNNSDISDHIRELLQDYQLRGDIFLQSPNLCFNDMSETAKEVGSALENEHYEKSVPAHGDLMFHHFISTIHENPGQIVRYSRDAFPLLISPLVENIPKCQYCGGECICELQILPTLISLLKLENNDLAPIEYGNVLVFTCTKSCWNESDTMKIENILVQQES